ncbi:MAG TPA: DHA2 family efflux MFS transporter permease subunit [bacterium]|nr:DHA2 family efflux MFS transporter permease subunit [bacterium]
MAVRAGAASPGIGAEGARGTNKWLVTSSILLGSIMATIDTSVVNIALIHMQATFGATIQDVTWVTTSYLITVALVMPLTAWLSSVVGRKRMYMFSVIIFTGASALCGFSRTLGQLIAFRVLQGLGGGALQPVAQAIMRETFPLREQAQAMGFFGMVVLLGPALGPTLGGYLVDNYSWPWIFFVNLPVGALSLFMVSQFIVDPSYMRARGLQKVDAVGIGLLVVGLTTLLTMLEQGERDGWFGSPFILGLATAAAVTLAAFIVWELMIPAPVVNLRILKDTSFAAGTLIIGVLGVALFGGLILLPLFLQNLLGYDATQSGLALMPRSLVMVAMMPIAGALYNRLGVYIMAPIGLLLAAASTFLMARFTLDTGPVQILIPQLGQGLAFAFIFVSISTTALSTIPRHQMQAATGLYNLVRQLGGSLGTAVVVTLVDHKTTTASANLVRYASTSNPTFMRWWQTFQGGFAGQGIDQGRAHLQALAVLAQAIAHQAAVVAFNYAFAMIAILFLCCLPLVLLLRRGERPDEPVPAAE